MAKKIHNIEGIEFGTASSNTRYGSRDDSLIVKLPPKSKLSGKFTSNKLRAAPVQLAIQNLLNLSKENKILLINAGNANAATGPNGLKDVKSYCSQIAKDSLIKKENIIPFSTGVIGESLPVKSYLNAFRSAMIATEEKNWKKAASAILTTDTKPKIVSKELKIGKTAYYVTGFAKGSGMIRPDFATLLSFVFIDADISQSTLNKIHQDALSESFETITVDGDTSPNDSSLLATNGNLNKKILKGSSVESRLAKIISEVFKELSELLVEDAEGATKKITVEVSQAKNLAQAKSVAFTVAESPLVKTAMFGSDANWGRILSAVGRDKSVADIDKVEIKLNNQPLVRRGFIDSRYSEKLASKEMKKKDININISLGLGKKKFKALTSDLSEDYVLINSDYRS
ncbi:MAG: bifunctional glutamate N-acetyltransferase/amino-acid acetyltransferase ArgJ [Gammaproteobacteria bacterium]|nr:MAG: bifunctional glutamate N-acetyltransferase/amino-acid acetyltransferase ArgJ [Gammaproteobacteria bacterium]